MGKMKEVYMLKKEHIEEYPEDKDKPDSFFFDLYLKPKEKLKIKKDEREILRDSVSQRSM